MTRAGLVLAVAMLAGCEGKEQPPVAMPPVGVTLGTFLSGEEFECGMPDQETLGRTIIMVARGWSDWPAPPLQGVEVTMRGLVEGKRYRMTVEEVKP